MPTEDQPAPGGGSEAYLWSVQTRDYLGEQGSWAMGAQGQGGAVIGPEGPQGKKSQTQPGA